jgi:alkylhydroperoxidase family enzyme
VSAPRVLPPRARGADPISGSALAYQPDTLRAFLRLYGTLWSHGVVDQASKELARIRNARSVNCAICKSIRFEGARKEGLSEALVEQVRDGYETSALSARQKAVLRWTDTFLSGAPEPDAAQRRDVLGFFTPAELVELTAGLALFMGFSKIAVSLGGMPESLPVTVQPTPDLPPGG